jgi:hypothetical protein
VLLCLYYSLIYDIKLNPVHKNLLKFNLNHLKDKSAILEWNLQDFQVNFIVDSEDVMDNQILILSRDEIQNVQIDVFHLDFVNKYSLSKITQEIVRLILTKVNRQ